MPIQTAEHWEEKARLAEETAVAMAHAPARFAMQEIARLYRQLARSDAKAAGAGREDVARYRNTAAVIQFTAQTSSRAQAQK